MAPSRTARSRSPATGSTGRRNASRITTSDVPATPKRTPSTVATPRWALARSRPMTIVIAYDSAPAAANALPTRSLSGVNGLDLVRVLLVDAPTLELHGGRHLVGVGEPLLAEHLVLLDLLDGV